MNTQNTSMSGTLELLDRLKREMPELWNQAQVVGRWVWVEFHTPPLRTVRDKLKELGFHWNAQRKCWQNPCGHRSRRARHDPRGVYQVTPAEDVELKDALPDAFTRTASEFKVVALRECPLPTDLHECDTPDKAADYWRLNVATNPYFNPEAECFVVLLLNTRRRVKGHQLLTIGTLDTVLVRAGDVFRVAVVAAAAAVILMHNHPSGDPTPSEADIKVTRDLIRAGQLLKIDVLDHVIVGQLTHCSLRELGYLAI